MTGTVLAAALCVAVLLAFAAAWRWAPKGTLTASTAGLGVLIEASHAAMEGGMYDLKAALPGEYQPWVVVVFMVLTIAARYRTAMSARGEGSAT